MTVRLSDVYNPVTFSRRIQEAQTKLNRFLRSGIAVSDPTLTSMFNAGGNVHEMYNFNPLGIVEPNYSNDNPADTSTPGKISSGVCRVRIAARNYSWSTMDLARDLAAEDPAQAIINRIAAFWASDDEQRLIHSCLGVYADNAANDSSDMIINIAKDEAGSVTDDERISGPAFIDAIQTLGDHKTAVTAMAVHSVVHARLMKQGLIDYIRDADNNVLFETYMGKRLIVDDSLPAQAGSNRIAYTCILFGAGAIVHANGRVNMPSEVERLPSSGNGGGQEVIYSRVNNAWHPLGFDFTSTTITGGAGGDGTNTPFATYANLDLAANWDRKYQRKNVPLAFLRVND